MMCARGVHVPKHFDRKQSENTKDGPFYEAKRRSKGWIILWSKTKKQRMDHSMKQTKPKHEVRFITWSILCFCVVLWVSLYSFLESFNFLMRMDHSMKQTKAKHEVCFIKWSILCFSVLCRGPLYNFLKVLNFLMCSVWPGISIVWKANGRRSGGRGPFWSVYIRALLCTTWFWLGFQLDRNSSSGASFISPRLIFGLFRRGAEHSTAGPLFLLFPRVVDPPPDIVYFWSLT